VRVDRLLGEPGLQGDTPEARQEFERRMEARRLEPGDELRLKELRWGWCLGSEGFRKQMLKSAEGQVGDHHFGQIRRETAQGKAQRLLAGELGWLEWPEARLASRPKSDPVKLQIAQRLRRQTTLTLKEISALVHLGTPRSASVRLHLALKKQVASNPAQGQLGI
jgi:hypothetical protein